MISSDLPADIDAHLGEIFMVTVEAFVGFWVMTIANLLQLKTHIFSIFW